VVHQRGGEHRGAVGPRAAGPSGLVGERSFILDIAGRRKGQAVAALLVGGGGGGLGEGVLDGEGSGAHLVVLGFDVLPADGEEAVVFLHGLLPLEVVELGGETAAGEVCLAGDAVGVGEALNGAGGASFVNGGFEEAVGEDVGEEVVGGGTVGEGDSGEFEEGGVYADATGVVVEGGETDAAGGEIELVEDGLVGGGLAVNDGLVDSAAEVGVGLVEDGGLGVNGFEVGRGGLVIGHGFGPFAFQGNLKLPETA